MRFLIILMTAILAAVLSPIASVAFMVPSVANNKHYSLLSHRNRGQTAILKSKTIALWTSSSGSTAAAISTNNMDVDTDTSKEQKQALDQTTTMSKWGRKVTKAGMIAFITTVAMGLITSLSGIKLLGHLGIGSTKKRQKWALSIGQFWARWALRIFPFCNIEVIADQDDDYWKNPEPCVWCSNHMSMLDVFVLLASDLRMRGKSKRPMKIVYVSSIHSYFGC